MRRRQFIRGTLMGLGGAPLAAALGAAERLKADPFTLGVASGEVTAEGAVLWTRLAPTPAEPRGGMPAADVAVRWELAADPAFQVIVHAGWTLASPQLAHSVHVEVDALEPDREYWYRFEVPGYRSPTGRTRTLPGAGEPRRQLRFVTASCQNYTHGYFTAYGHMLRDEPDFVIHLGDYLYETDFGESFRTHPGERAPQTLDDFRRWHALYKTDPHLQAAHAALPFFLMIDNHDAIADNDPARSALRAAAYQAWYEHMPVRGWAGPGTNRFNLHRCIVIGDLVQICLLDARQFRDAIDVCRGPYDPAYGFGNYRQRCPAVFDAQRSMLGEAQTDWLTQRIRANRAAWNVVASPGPFMPFSYRVDGEDRRYVSAWDAYPANRQRVAEALVAAATGNPLVLSGDVHSFWAVDGARTPAPEERFPIIEFTTSSISANWPPALAQPVTDNLPHNPQVSFYDPAHRGYLLHDVTSTEWICTARGVDSVHVPDARVSDLAAFRVHRDYTLTVDVMS